MHRTPDPYNAQFISDARWFRIPAMSGNNGVRSAAAALKNRLRDRFKEIEFMDAASSVSASASTAAMHPPYRRLSVATADSADASNRVIQDLLRTMRALLDMDIAFVSEFVDDHLTLRHLDTEPASASLASVGDSTPLAQTYCKRVADGHFPNAIPDVLQIPETAGLPGTASLKIAAYLSVPVTLRTGEIYGTLCCISHAPRTALGNRQIDALRKVAEIVSHEVEKLRG
jgi:hypothetical protein